MARIEVRGAGLLRAALTANEARFVHAVRRAIRSAANPEEVPLPTDPDAEAQRLADQRRRIAAMEAPEALMVQVHAIAGFELGDIFAEWARRWAPVAIAASAFSHRSLDGLGPPLRLHDETYEEFGERIARGILRLLKEV